MAIDSRHRRTALSRFCPDSLCGVCQSRSEIFSRDSQLGRVFDSFRSYNCECPDFDSKFSNLNLILTDRHRTVIPDRIRTTLSADV